MRGGQGPSAKNAKKALLARVHALLNTYFQKAFKRRKTFLRLTDLMLALVVGIGSKTLTSALTFTGNDQGIYGANYKVFSEATWEQQELFRGVFRASARLLPCNAPVVVALDDTPLDKTSYTLPFTRWCHNGCGPKWVRPSLKWGMPCSHAALLIPAPETFRSNAVSLSFDPIPGKSAKRKRRNGTKRGRPKKGQVRPSTESVPPQPPKATEVAVETIVRIRGWMDAEGMKDRDLWMVVDGSYVNRTVIEGLPDRTILIGRARKDAVLFKPLE